MATANNRVMTDATGQEILSALQNLAAVQAVPYVASIPTGQWSGSGNDYYITINASNVTANSIIIPNYDNDSSKLLKGPVWCVPAAGSFTIHTSAIPAGTVTIMVMFAGTMGEAQYQVLADVYSKSQTDAAIQQSTAIETGIAKITMDKLSFTKKGSIYLASVSLPDETYSIPAGVKIVQVCKYGGGIGTIPFVQTDNDGSNLNVLAIDNPGNNSYHYINVRWYK